MLGHLVDEHARQRAIRGLRNHIVDLSADNFTACILPSNCLYHVDLDVAVDIAADLLRHRLRHSFVAASRVAECMVVIFTIVLKVVADNGGSRCDEWYRRDHALQGKLVPIVNHYFCNCQHFRRCYFLDALHVVLGKPFELFGSDTFEVDKLD